MQSAISSQLGLAHRSGSLQESLAGKALLIVGATAFVAACAHISLPLPFTPVPLTLQNFAVLLVGMALGPVAGFSAMVLYLARRRYRASRLHSIRGWRRSTSPRAQRRLSLLLPPVCSDCRPDRTPHAARHHPLPQRSGCLHRRHPAHLPARRRLACPLPPSQRFSNMGPRRRSLHSRRNRQDHRCRRHLQRLPALAALLTGAPLTTFFLPTPSRLLNSAHLTLFHLPQGRIAS